MNGTPLNPCPRTHPKPCTGAPHFVTTYRVSSESATPVGYFVKCPDCKRRGAVRMTKALAQIEWNRENPRQ